MPLDSQIALGGAVRQPSQQDPLAGIASLMQLVHMVQQNKKLDAESERLGQRTPLELELLRAQTANTLAQAPEHAAKTVTAQLAAREAMSQAQGRAELMKLFDGTNPDQYTQGSVANQVYRSPAEALQAVREAEARGVPASAVAPNTGTLQSLLLKADPKAAMTSLNRAPSVQRGVVVGPGAAYVAPGGNAPSFVQPFAERAPQRPQFVNSAQGILRSGPEGLTPELGPDGKPFMPASATSTTNTQAMGLAREFNSHPAVKIYETITPSIRYAAQYMAGVPKNGATATDDAALTKVYLAMTHPKGDQITNLDMRGLLALPDLPDRIKASIGGFINGRKLPDDIRNEFWNVISNKYKALDYQKTEKRKDIENRAKSMGVDPSLVFGDR